MATRIVIEHRPNGLNWDKVGHAQVRRWARETLGDTVEITGQPITSVTSVWSVPDEHAAFFLMRWQGRIISGRLIRDALISAIDEHSV